MKTSRLQKNLLMSKEEKEQYVKIIRKMPYLYKLILTEISKYAKNSSGLIDVACGDGYLLSLVNKKYSSLKLMGIDRDSFMIKKAIFELPFRFLKKDADKISRKEDIITCNLALHHFNNPVKLIKSLYKSANKVVIISDQLRPQTEKELAKRLNKRREFVGKRDLPYYRKKERQSILEAYSKEEIIQIFKKTGLKHKIRFIDKDYYERFVAIIEK